MNLTHLSDSELENETLKLVKAEREILTSVLHHLCEVDRRRLYSKFGFKSLFAYAVERFRYSEDEAYRRISAMRLLVEVPMIEEKIEAGVLSLSNIAQAQTLFRQEKRENRELSIEVKTQVLEKIENCTKAQAGEILRVELGHGLPAEELFDYSFKADSDLQKKLSRLLELRGLSARDLAKLIDFMSDVVLERIDPVKKAERSEKRLENSRSDQKLRVVNKEAAKAVENSKVSAGNVRSGTQQTSYRYIPSALRHAVYLRDRGQCTNCGSTRFTEVDHVKPFSVGGEHSLENLRLLCRSCNQRKAIEVFGFKKMQKFLREPIASYH